MAIVEQHNRYTAADIAKLIDLLRASRDYSLTELAGMDKLADLLICLESMQADDIESAVKRYFRSV